MDEAAVRLERAAGKDATLLANLLELYMQLRKYRRSGVGRRAAALLFDMLRARWTVRVLEANDGALAFWRETVREVTNGGATEAERRDANGVWRVFEFDSGRGAA